MPLQNKTTQGEDSGPLPTGWCRPSLVCESAMPHETQAIDIRKLFPAGQPDAEGSVIPATVQYGSVVVSSGKGETQPMTVALGDTISNVSTATCGICCYFCNGVSTFSVTANPFACLVGQMVQLKATGT